MNPRKKYAVSSGGRAAMRKFWKQSPTKTEVVVGKGIILGVCLVTCAVMVALAVIGVFAL